VSVTTIFWRAVKLNGIFFLILFLLLLYYNYCYYYSNKNDIREKKNAVAIDGALKIEDVFIQRLVKPNHENEDVRNIGQGEAPHRKYKRLKLGGGHVYDCSSV
jgi:hypothetical protein